MLPITVLAATAEPASLPVVAVTEFPPSEVVAGESPLPREVVTLKEIQCTTINKGPTAL